ncbi:diaminopimelate epimerase [Pseudomonas sp. LS1212]|uniref:diaminopimelate epimerase n=1 Tax=Pseudomonas sp. LS1212 TaxID=2972478 RepID=UPI00215C767D|nr:diaminopimelate epimerase [Pseudomonas sp. LS1212]UVJ42972.1 diaminopimelate epimerase [Pseudomonas sp. LS1212]
MTTLYDARGNIYAVVSPHHLRELGIALPETAAQAALTRRQWAPPAIAACCDWPEGSRPQGAKAHRSDGLLVGLFQDKAPFDLLIVNTDGSLAERSGNGLTIFAQALTDQGLTDPNEAFALRVHHDKTDSPSPVATYLEPAVLNGTLGFWLDLGTPTFGPGAVGAQAGRVTETRPTSQVQRLAQLDPRWDRSVFVRIGNPHCVSLLADPNELPDMNQLRAKPLHDSLTRIAFASDSGLGEGDPCPAGVNLQWAALEREGLIAARVFERGEGPTESSGTSASAVACAAWLTGLVKAGTVQVRMPGGTAPVRLQESEGKLERVSLFGTAQRMA